MRKERPFVGLVRKCIALARRVADEQVDKGMQHILMGMSPKEFIKHIRSPGSAANQALTNWVRALGQLELAKLQTVMYWGRDEDDETRGDELVELHSHLAGCTTKREVIAMTILEKKKCLADYLRAALRRAKAENINLETVL